MEFFLGGLGNLAVNLDRITECVIEADRLGFNGALMPDHYMWGEMRGHQMPNAYSTLETWVTLTYLAGKTEKISLGTLVTPLPFRPPGILAKMISTLDIASGGRVILGVGAGWSQDEFEAYSTWGNTKYRVDKTVEGLKLMVELWTKDNVNFNGKFYHAKDAVLDPKPVQKPYPRLLFGSQGDRMLRLTGRYGEICFIPPWAGNVTSIKETVLDSAKKYGRTEKIRFMIGDMGSREPFNEESLYKKISSAEESGATIYLTSFPRENHIESMNNFAENIMPSFSK